MKWGGKESAQLNKLEEYLKQLKLLDSRNSYPNGGFNLSAVRGLDYVDVWKTHVKHQWYDLRLDDNSLFFFNKEGDDANFSYLGCPYLCEPYSAYRTKAEFEGFEESFIQELYEDELTSSDVNLKPYYFRYDYEEGSYREGEHPVSHLHFGLMESVRIGLSKTMDVMSFAAFILRQVYVHHWSMVLYDEHHYHELHICKNNLTDINPVFYKKFDQHQDFYLV